MKRKILHGFDLPASMSGVVFKDQVMQFITTAMGLYSLEHRVNLVMPYYGSLSYESRLAKYLERGYWMVLVGLDMTKIRGANNSKRFKLSHLEIVVSNVIENRIYGYAHSLNNDETDYGPSSCKEDKYELMSFYRNPLRYKYAAWVKADTFTNGIQAITQSLIVKELQIKMDEMKWYLPNANIAALRKDYDIGYKNFCQISWKCAYTGTIIEPAFNPRPLTPTAWYGSYYQNCDMEIMPIITGDRKDTSMRSNVDIRHSVTKSDIKYTHTVVPECNTKDAMSKSNVSAAKTLIQPSK